MKNINRKFYILKIAGYLWETGYYAYRARGAIRQFLADDRFYFYKDLYKIEVSGHSNYFIAERTADEYKMKKYHAR